MLDSALVLSASGEAKLGTHYQYCYLPLQKRWQKSHKPLYQDPFCWVPGSGSNISRQMCIINSCCWGAIDHHLKSFNVSVIVVTVDFSKCLKHTIYVCWRLIHGLQWNVDGCWRRITLPSGFLPLLKSTINVNKIAENHFHTSCRSIVTCACAPWTIPLHPRRIRLSHQAQWTLGLVFQRGYYYSPMYPTNPSKCQTQHEKCPAKHVHQDLCSNKCYKWFSDVFRNLLGHISSFNDLDGVGVILKQDDHFRLQIGFRKRLQKLRCRLPPESYGGFAVCPRSWCKQSSVVQGAAGATVYKDCCGYLLGYKLNITTILYYTKHIQTRMAWKKRWNKGNILNELQFASSSISEHRVIIGTAPAGTCWKVTHILQASRWLTNPAVETPHW